MSVFPNQSTAILQVPGKGKIEFIKVSDILFIKALSNYSQIFLMNNRNVTVSKTLKHFESSISNIHFIRCHRSYILNCIHIKLYHSGKNARFELTNGFEIPASREGIEKVQKLYRSL